MISSINSGMSMPPPRSSQEQTLSTEQQTLISDTLAEFDAENLTEEDALSIIETFSEAGINPSGALETAMSDMGFDTKTIGDLANPEGASAQGGMPPPPPPPQDSEEISSMVSYLSDLIEEQITASDTNELSDQARQDIYAQVMEKFGMDDGDSIINTTA
ncbi:hypothetical protein ACLKMH_07525 [Psychromonas sp. KJ10-10]|uniref:hypothetical protein n=1 Tax=Psychromonas sp. KJ10-10 TaxID=3391823 RepID=UPI0039B5BB54